MELFSSPEEIEHRRRRDAARAAWVQQCRWSGLYAPDLHRRWAGPPFGITNEVFDRGESGSAVTGRYRGRPAVVFDYSQVRETESGHETLWHTICAQALPVEVPSLQVVRQARQDNWVAALNGFADVFQLPNRLRTKQLTTGDQIFDEQYEVRTDNPAFAREVLVRKLRQWLILAEGWSWRLQAQDALVWQLGRWTPESADAGLRFLAAVLDRIPTLVWSTAGQGAVSRST